MAIVLAFTLVDSCGSGVGRHLTCPSNANLMYGRVHLRGCRCHPSQDQAGLTAIVAYLQKTTLSPE